MKEYDKIFFVEDIQDTEYFNLSIRKDGNTYILSYKHSLLPNLFYYKYNGEYIYSYNEERLAEYIISQGINLTESSNWVDFFATKGHKQDDTLKTNHYNDIGRICLYEKVIISKENFWATYINDIFCIPINYSGNIIYNWIRTYQQFCNDNYNDIIPELSAGLDTRSLTYFWRNLPITDVYTKEDINEYPIVEKLLPTFSNAKLNIGHKPKKKYTLSGKGGDLFGKIRIRFCNASFYANLICQINRKKLIEDITPYLDRNLIRIRPNYMQELKVVFQYLLAKDLMGITYLSTLRDKFEFTNEMKEYSERMIANWKAQIEFEKR